MKQILIKCGKMYDGIDKVFKKNQQILVEGDRIVAVGETVDAAADAQVIDLSDKTVTPGLMDAHVHMSFFDANEIGKDVVYYSDSMRTLAAAECARRSLHGGFTTIRHVGWFREDRILDVKRAINAGYIEGARIVAAPHFLCAPGSHGDPTQGIATNPALSDHLETEYPTMGSGADFFRASVRHEVKIGADFIKIMATGGFFTPNDSPDDIQLEDDELEAIINTANSLHTTVTAHAYTDKLIQKLVKMGIHGIEHASLMHEETAQMMKEAGVYLVPTFVPYEEIVHYDEEMLKTKPIEMQRKLASYRDNLVESREVIKNSGLLLGYGTDIVSGHPNYENGWEFVAWMRSGLTALDALEAATKNNAKILQLKDLGAIAPGYIADISAWNRDPETDEMALLDCGFVMKEGKIYEATSFMNKE